MNQATEPKRRGRKPLAEGQGKTARIEIRTDDSTKARLQAAADAAGESLAAYMVRKSMLKNRRSES